MKTLGFPTILSDSSLVAVSVETALYMLTVLEQLENLNAAAAAEEYTEACRAPMSPR